MTDIRKQRNRDLKRQLEYCGTVDIWVVHVLADMAERGEYPDGSFSDSEVGIWELFQRFKK